MAPPEQHEVQIEITTSDDYPEVKTWAKRGGAAPHVPGQPEEMLECLRAVLRAVDEGVASEHEISWPSGGSTTMRDAVGPLSTSGLIARDGTPARFVLTTAGHRFLRDAEDEFLIATFHANIRYIGEILVELGDGSTHADLNAAAQEKYGLAWNSRDQIRRRVNWLRATGMVEFWSNNRITLTERGKTLSTRLKSADPASLAGTINEEDSVDLPEPPPQIAAYLDELDDVTLRNRNRVIGYIAGGLSAATIRSLLKEAHSPIPRAHFVALCSKLCQVATSGAEQTLNTLKSLGLIEQIGPDAFSATAIAAEWATSGDPLDFVRILHGQVLLLGELLNVIDEQADAGHITRALENIYPDFTLSRKDVTSRLALLVEAGLVERLGIRIRKTPAGVAFAKSLPLLASGESNHTHPDPQTVHADHRTAIKELQKNIIEAAHNSAEPHLFESVLADAFRALGFDVEHCGGKSRTDVLVSLWASSTERVKIAVEAKTDGGGVVTEQDVKFPALAEHRSFHDARTTLLVGPSFSSRLTQWAAADEKVVLLTARQMADLLERQANTPLYPREFNALLTAGDHDSQERVWHRTERRQSVVAHVLDIMWKSANDPVDIEYGQGALSVSEIWRESKTLLDNPMDRSEIEEALSFLSTPLLAAVRKVDQNHVITTAPASVAVRLRALADMIESRGNPVTSEPRQTKVSPPAVTESRPQSARGKVNPSEVRAWAAANRRHVSKRGRLPTMLLDEFLAANESP